MRFRAAPSVVIVRREEKEGKLKDFIAEILAAPVASSDQVPPPSCISVVARSIDSPVIKALAAVAAERGHLDARIALAVVDVPVDAVAAALAPISSACRHLADPRHLHAHEQLILGGASCWIGDCMRREPAKRDAYEQYVRDCALTTAWASTAFERLWSSASPVLRARPQSVQPPVTPADLAAAAAALGVGGDLPPTTAASTRH